jgi:transaldolase
LISPFVGRIYDWYKKSAGSQWDEAANAGARDPGVQSVARIYNYYKKHGIKTEVMGASFRNTGQIIALAGCDLLTISPELLAQLQSTELEVQPALSRDKAAHMALPEVHLHESSFRFAMNDEDMAHTKLAEGIRAFCSDTEKLDTLLLK